MSTRHRSPGFEVLMLAVSLVHGSIQIYYSDRKSSRSSTPCTGLARVWQRWRTSASCMPRPKPPTRQQRSRERQWQTDQGSKREDRRQPLRSRPCPARPTSVSSSPLWRHSDATVGDASEYVGSKSTLAQSGESLVGLQMCLASSV